MGEMRRKFDRDFKEGAVRLVRETGKPIAQVARELGIHDRTLGNWVNADRRRRRQAGDGLVSEDERAELARLRKENAELAMRCDVLKRSVASGYPIRWAGSRGHVHRLPEGGARHPARGVLPGAGSQPGLVLQVGRGGELPPRAARRQRLKPRSRTCSGSMRASTGRRGSPSTSKTTAGGPARTPSLA